jgi:hypothetical protein
MSSSKSPLANTILSTLKLGYDIRLESGLVRGMKGVKVTVEQRVPLESVTYRRCQEAIIDMDLIASNVGPAWHIERAIKNCVAQLEAAKP